MGLREIACDVDKLTAVALKLCQVPQNFELRLYCFASDFKSLQFSNICNVSYGKGDEPSGSTMVGFLNGLFRICQGNANREISFTGKTPEITFKTNVSCLAKEGCIPSVALFRNKQLATVIRKEGTMC
jgi:hypothetical protein